MSGPSSLTARAVSVSLVAQFDLDPDEYMAEIRAELPRYDELEDAVARATHGADAKLVERARARLPEMRVDALAVARLEDPLPTGPFDLVVSALVVHHLESRHKRDLLQRLGTLLEPGARFVLGDVFLPERPEDAVTPLEPGVDLPDPLDDKLQWLAAAGFEAVVEWSWKDLAVVRGDRR